MRPVLIEGESAVLRARRRSDEDLKRFESIFMDSRQAIDDPNRHGELDFLFYMRIAQSSGNVFIQSMMGCLNDYTRRYTPVVAHAEISRNLSIIPHEEIYACIKNRDTGRAGVVTRKHLSRMLAIMEQLEAERKIIDSGGDLRSVLDLLKQKEGPSSAKFKEYRKGATAE